jgi:hypothetical protein
MDLFWHDLVTALRYALCVGVADEDYLDAPDLTVPCRNMGAAKASGLTWRVQ